ncbi:MAG: hypothetical protein C7B46_20545, partial [Sulfobacillus benefaciens]
VHTTIGPHGSGTIVWTASDSVHDITSNGGLSVAQVTTLLQKNAPPGATVSGPISQNGQEVWTITDHFASIHQLNTILQAATGPNNFQPVTMHLTQTAPWARTYPITDPDNSSGNQWNWVTKALQNAGNSSASNWQSGSSTDTLTLPWITSPGIPSETTLTQRDGQPPGFGITWFAPQYTLQWSGVMGAHPVLHGTWAMRFSAQDWQLMPHATQTAIQSWWHHRNPQAHFAIHKGAPTWTAPVTITPGKNGPWGMLTVRSAALPSKTTFWRQDTRTAWTFVPNATWLLPPAWAAAGLSTPEGWNGALQWHTHWVMPFGSQLLTGSSTLEGSWQAVDTWSSVRWGHVALAGLGVLIGVILLILGALARRRHLQTITHCPACHARIPASTKFCTQCGTSLVS